MEAVGLESGLEGCVGPGEAEGGRKTLQMTERVGLVTVRDEL